MVLILAYYESIKLLITSSSDGITVFRIAQLYSVNYKRSMHNIRAIGLKSVKAI